MVRPIVKVVGVVGALLFAIFGVIAAGFVMVYLRTSKRQPSDYRPRRQCPWCDHQNSMKLENYRWYCPNCTWEYDPRRHR